MNPGEPHLEQVLEELEAARFLARASASLAEVVDYESTLERIARLAVPAFADWFGVHIREPDGSLRRIAVRHLDPRMEAAVVEMYRRYPPTEPPVYGAPQVVATGEPILLEHFPVVIPAIARDETHAGMLRAIGLRSFACVPMRSQGEVLGALTFATAESGRVYSDLHFRAAEDLAARAAIAIDNARLLEALREADRRKDEFLAILAHELRNPLAPVRNAVDILRARPKLEPEARWVSDVLDRQVRQLSRLVDDLLDVSRITSGKIELRRAPLRLGDAVADAVEATRPAIERAGQRLAVSLPTEPLWLEADAVRVSQVVSNLLNNASRYSPPGGAITLQVRREEGEAVICVRDEGQGIPPEMLERIFEMFVQVGRVGERPQGGLGLGLTLVRRLVALHGGTVSARSDGEGRGAEFVVRLPAAVAPPQTQGAGGVGGRHITRATE